METSVQTSSRQDKAHEDRLRRALRAAAPGLVRGVEMGREGQVTVVVAPQRDGEEARETTRRIREALLACDGVAEVNVRRLLPTWGTPPDPEAARQGPPNLAGDEQGAACSPEAALPDPLPVYAWELDPNGLALPTAEAEVEREGREYRLWWQEHPAGLVYASVQALAPDAVDEGERTTGAADAHPVGRTVVTNVVYDQARRAVVAIYGTARDGRPFLEAFREAFGARALVRAEEGEHEGV